MAHCPKSWDCHIQKVDFSRVTIRVYLCFLPTSKILHSSLLPNSSSVIQWYTFYRSKCESVEDPGHLFTVILSSSAFSCTFSHQNLHVHLLYPLYLSPQFHSAFCHSLAALMVLILALAAIISHAWFTSANCPPIPLLPTPSSSSLKSLCHSTSLKSQSLPSKSKRRWLFTPPFHAITLIFESKSVELLVFQGPFYKAENMHSTKLDWTVLQLPTFGVSTAASCFIL